LASALGAQEQARKPTSSHTTSKALQTVWNGIERAASTTLTASRLPRLRRRCTSTPAKKLLYEFLRINHVWPAS
ncbi:MAG: hypothetical protein R3311_17425, partial [Oceanisphaera sp.]|nr:hypothetical protein [Oceanisphaera sp.]